MVTDRDDGGMLDGPIITQALIEERAGRPITSAYDAMVAQLESAGMVEGALKPGAPMPDFLLPNADGRLVSRDALLAKGPVLISFVRGHWCPFCREEMLALQGLTGTDIQLAVITPEIGGRAQNTRQKLGLSYEMLCDIDHGLALACGLLFRVPDAIRLHYAGTGIDLPAFQGNDGWMLPLPATYGLDADGIVRFAYVNVDFRRRLDPAIFAAAMARLKA